MFFEYLKTTQFQDSIDIESIGNVCLQSINDMADCWVLLIHTIMGESEVIQAGPINLDFDSVSPNVFISRTKFDYNEKKLHKIIYDFMNNPKHIITCVEIIDDDIGKKILKKITDSL